MKRNYPLSRKSNVVVQELDGEVLIYDLNNNKAFCLNETSALVWQMCDGNKSVAEISQAIGKELNSPANKDLVWLALDQLKKENLLKDSDELVIDFKGMTRRDVIKKVGYGTLLAIPVIMSITAPQAYAAASACNRGGVFVGSGCFAADPGCTIANLGTASPDQSSFNDGCNLGGATPGCTCKPTYSGGNYICSGVGVRQGTCG